MLGCIEKWQQAKVDHSGSDPDTAVNALIAEREEIEGANSHTASAMKESRQRSAMARASQNRWHESPFGSLFVSKGRTLDHRRSEQQQAPVAESLRLPPAEHGGRKWALETPHLHDRTRLEHSGRHSTPPGWRYRLALRFAISKET
jgi:hypothetical protein